MDFFEFEGVRYTVVLLDDGKWTVQVHGELCTIRVWKQRGFYDAALTCRAELFKIAVSP